MGHTNKPVSPQFPKVPDGTTPYDAFASAAEEFSRDWKGISL